MKEQGLVPNEEMLLEGFNSASYLEYTGKISKWYRPLEGEWKREIEEVLKVGSDNNKRSALSVHIAKNFFDDVMQAMYSQGVDRSKNPFAEKWNKVIALTLISLEDESVSEKLQDLFLSTLGGSIKIDNDQCVGSKLNDVPFAINVKNEAYRYDPTEINGKQMIELLKNIEKVIIRKV